MSELTTEVVGLMLLGKGGKTLYIRGLNLLERYPSLTAMARHQAEVRFEVPTAQQVGQLAWGFESHQSVESSSQDQPVSAEMHKNYHSPLLLRNMLLNSLLHTHTTKQVIPKLPNRIFDLLLLVRTARSKRYTIRTQTTLR